MLMFAKCYPQFSELPGRHSFTCHFRPNDLSFFARVIDQLLKLSESVLHVFGGKNRQSLLHAAELAHIQCESKNPPCTAVF